MSLDECEQYCNNQAECNSITYSDQNHATCYLNRNEKTDSDPMVFDDDESTYFRKCGKVDAQFSLYLAVNFEIYIVLIIARFNISRSKHNSVSK